MRKIYSFIFIVLSFCVKVSAQGQKISIVRDTTIKLLIGTATSGTYENRFAVVLDNGEIIQRGSVLKLGKGSLPNGDFDFIATPSNTMDAKLKANPSVTSIKLIDIKKKGDKKSGYKYVFFAEDRYIIQLENALNSGEIVF